MSQNDRKAAESRKVGETPKPNISFAHHFAANTTANQFVIKPVVKEGTGACFEIVTTATKVQAEPKKDDEPKPSLVEAFCKQTDENKKKAPEPKTPEPSGGAKQRHTSTIFIGSSKKKDEASNKEVEGKEKPKALESSKPHKHEESEPRSRRQRGLNKIKSSGSLVTDSTVKKVVTISAKNLEAKTISLTNSKPGSAGARKVYTRKLHNAGGKSHNSNVSSSSSENETPKKQESQKSKAPEAEEVNAREQRRNRRMRARMVGSKQQQKPHLLKQQLSAENVLPAKTEAKKTGYRRQRRSKELKAGGGGREKNLNMNIPPSMIKRSHPWAKQIFMLSNELSDEDKYSTLPANFRPTYDLASDPKKFGGNQQGAFRNFKPASNSRKEKFPGFKETVSLDSHTTTPIKTPPRTDSKRGFVKKPPSVQPCSNKFLQNNQLKKTSPRPTEKLHNGNKPVEREGSDKQMKNVDRFPSNADLSLNEEKDTKQESENENSRNALVIARPLAKAKKIGEHFWPRDKDTEKLLGKNNLSQESEENSITDKTDACAKTDNCLTTNVEKDINKSDENDTNQHLSLEVNNINSKEDEKPAVEPKKCTNPFLNFSDSELNNPLEEELKKFSKITQDMKSIEENQNVRYENENSFNFDKINPSLANLGSSRNMNDEINRTSQRKDSVVSMSTALPTRKPQISSADYDEAVIEIDEVLNEFRNIAYDNAESKTPARVDQDQYSKLLEPPKASEKVEGSDDKLVIRETADRKEEKQEEESYDSFAATDTISSSTSSQKNSNRPASADAKAQKKKSHSDPNTNAVRKASLLSNVEVEKRPNSCSEPLMSENYDTLSGLDKYKRYQISKTLQSSKQQKKEALKPHRSSCDIYAPDKLHGEIPDFENQFELGKEEKQFREMCDILTSSTSQVSIHQPDYAAPPTGQVISHSRSCSAPVNPTDGYVEASRRYATVEPLEDMKDDEELLGSKKGISTSADNLNASGELRGKYLPVSCI